MRFREGCLVRKITPWLGLLLLTLWLGASGESTLLNAADTADDASPLVLYPERLTLQGPRARLQLVVLQRDATGQLLDVTRQSRFQTDLNVTIDPQGQITPHGDGVGTLTVEFAGHNLSRELRIEGMSHSTPISFRWETSALLTKLGCNGGACHGKPNGRGALELSLNAFDPELDERSLLLSGRGRFLDPIDPSASLLLRKPTVQVAHGGGRRLKEGDPTYELLREWIAQGAPIDPSDSPVCIGVSVEPGPAVVLDRELSPTQQFRVSARFSDGSLKDVTELATWTVSHTNIATVDSRGLVTGRERGQTAVSVRYLDELVSVPLTVVQQVPGFVWQPPAERGEIDRLVHAKLLQLRYGVAQDVDDATFLRRLSLDLRGLLPTVEEVRAFGADSSPQKREWVIDRFLASPEHAAFWALRMADLLRIGPESIAPEQAEPFARWIRQSLENNQPYDQFCRQMLTATGSTLETPAAEYFRVTSESRMVAESVAQVFLGSRIQCAQCHNHPYERWTQDNYYQIGAAFHQVDRIELDALGVNPGQGGDRRRVPLRISITDRPLENPRTGKIQSPWPPEIQRSPGADARVAFVDWLVAPGNPFFARVAVNRMWAHLFGQGLVEPIDDFRSSNPASNPELLDYLAGEFERSGFDRRALLKSIVMSATYQRASVSHAVDREASRFGGNYAIRLLSAEQLQDAITRLCDEPQVRDERTAALKSLADRRGALPEESTLTEESARKQREQQSQTIDRELAELRRGGEANLMTQRPFPELTPFLVAFGQPARTTACACERPDDVSLDQALQFMNGPLVRDKVSRGARRYVELDDSQLILTLYEAAYARSPQESELATVQAFLNGSEDRLTAIEDLLWSLINTHEFMFQH